MICQYCYVLLYFGLGKSNLAPNVNTLISKDLCLIDFYHFIFSNIDQKWKVSGSTRDQGACGL